ncbi:MAG: HDOD domain-containing protein [Gammaproteobacteria bacterium]|nr:HDOD domain-containing protein [Gammaproteobacteria bacterium]
MERHDHNAAARTAAEGAAADTAPSSPLSVAAFDLARQLARDVSVRQLELPSYPEVALRVQRVLADPGADTGRIARVMGAEPVLAAHVLAMANSAACAAHGQPVTDLRAAVNRLGVDTLRTAAIAFALGQLRKAAAYRGIEKELSALWQQSALLSATSCVVARAGRRFSPDSALLAGLVAGVGRLYLLTRARDFPVLFADPATWQSLVRNWHVNVARAVLESWSLPEDVIEAATGWELAAEDPRKLAQLADVLAVAALLIDLRADPQQLTAVGASHLPRVRLGVAVEDCAMLLEQSAAEVAALRAALGQ